MTFTEWLNTKKTREFVYLHATRSGQLSIWRENQRINMKLSDEAEAAVVVGQQALDAYLAGKVYLFQRRTVDGFEYIAIRRKGEPPELFEQWKWKEWQRSQIGPIKRREKRERDTAAA